MHKRFLCKLKNDEEIIIENDVVLIKTKFDKRAWAEKIIKNHWNDRYYCILPFTRTVVVFDTRNKTKKPGVAFCHITDEFDYAIGRAIALCRVKGLHIPKEIFE